MTIADMTRRQTVLAAALMVLLALLAAAQLMQGWSAWRADAARAKLAGMIAEQSLCAVTLVTGQVYYGTVAGIRAGQLRLSDVYYAQSTPSPGGAPAQFQLVSRRKNDWHGPTWMAIPLDRIQYVEDVAPASRLASLIAQDRAAAAVR